MLGFSFCILAAGVAAQGITLPGVSYSYTATLTVTSWVTVTTTTCPCTTATTSSLAHATNPALTYSSSTMSGLATPSSATTTATQLVSGSTIAQSFTTSLTMSVSPPSNPGASTTPSSGIMTLTTSTTAGVSEPSVTNSAYINAILRHHNVHRTNHSANALTWSPSLAETARIIAQSCVYGHVTDLNGGGYGQNIGAGYQAGPLSMGRFITEGLYNSEVNSYTAYGSEPNTNDFTLWGHFTQVVWKSTTSIGCYTADCSSGGLANASSIPPYFTVCNYSPPGNYVGQFNANIGASLGMATVYADY